MRRLTRIADALDGLVVGIGRAAAWAVVALILVTVFDVITRNFSQSGFEAVRDLIALQQRWFGSTRLQELEWHLHTVLFAFCLGFAYLRGAHVRIDLVRDRLGDRARWWIEAAGVILLLLPFAAVLIYFTTDFAALSFAQNEVSASGAGLGGRWIIKAALPAGFVLLAAAGVTVLLRRMRMLFGASDTGGGNQADR